MSDLPSPDATPGPDGMPSPATVATRRPLTLTRLRPALPWVVALAAVLLILMAAAVAIRRHQSAVAPIPGSPTTASASPQP